MCDKTDVALNRLQKLIDGSGKTRQQIANDLYCDTSTITKHYKGDRNITTEYLVKYAKYFGVSVDYLLGLSNTPSYDTNLRAVCDYTGLSNDAVKTLHKFSDNKYMYDEVLNLFLGKKCSSDFCYFCGLIMEYKSNYEELVDFKEKIIKTHRQRAITDIDKIVDLSIQLDVIRDNRDICEFRLQKIIHEFLNTYCDEILEREMDIDYDYIEYYNFTQDLIDNRGKSNGDN